jgi:hypothetical protein
MQRTRKYTQNSVDETTEDKIKGGAVRRKISGRKCCCPLNYTDVTFY